MMTPSATTSGVEASEAFPAPSLRRIALASAVTVALGFGGLGTWAALTPLDSAVPATGAFVAADKRKTVTLIDSGILKALLVKEGDHVAAGQPLLLLEDVQARVALNQADAMHWGGIAKTTRLDAEITDKRTLDFPTDLLAAAQADPATAAVVQAERALFAAHWDAFDGNARITGRKVQQLHLQETAVLTQIQSLNTRLALTQEQTRGVESLLKDGYAPKTQALEMRRGVAELQGALGDAQGRLLQAQASVEQTKLELTGQVESHRAEAARDMQEAKVMLADVAQRQAATRDVLRRAVVTAPEAGAVTDIHAFTPGSSITAGQPVLDIVPGDGRLLIEASVAPTDIEHVHVGQRVNIKLSAYKAHRVPTVEGTLVYVAADRQPDAHGEQVFLVRAELDRDALKPFPGVLAYAGMPADILIIGGERSALDFIISPFLDGMGGGMREE